MRLCANENISEDCVIPKKNDARVGPAEDRQKLTQDVLNALARSLYH
jgi:hypothetical protein